MHPAVVSAISRHGGPAAEVVASAVDPTTGVVAWIEAGPGCLRLRVDRGAVVHDLPCYNPWFGCDIRNLGWHEGVVVALYREKHLVLLVRLGATLEMTVLPEASEVLGEVAWGRDRDGLLRGWRLPTFTPTVPVPAPSDVPIAEIALPPPDLVLPDLRAPLRRLLRAAGVPSEHFGGLMDHVLRPWPPPLPRISTSYAELDDAPRPRPLTPGQRAALAGWPSHPPTWGWTGDVDPLLHARVMTLLARR